MGKGTRDMVTSRIMCHRDWPPGRTGAGLAGAEVLFDPCPAEEMAAYPMSTHVNRPAQRRPALWRASLPGLSIQLPATPFPHAGRGMGIGGLLINNDSCGKMVPRGRIELPTPPLPRVCSTSELPRRDTVEERPFAVWNEAEYAAHPTGRQRRGLAENTGEV